MMPMAKMNVAQNGKPLACPMATMRLTRDLKQERRNGVASQMTGRNLRDIHHGHVIIGKSAQIRQEHAQRRSGAELLIQSSDFEKIAKAMHTTLDTFRGYIEGQTRLAAERPRRELPVVTISRETGAGAITVASLVAKELNLRRTSNDVCPWTVFDRNLVEKVLEDHELPATLRQFVHEDAAVFDLRKVIEEMLGLHPSDWTLVHHTTDTILRLAQLGNVILIGRGANVITAQFKNAFHVRLVAPLDARIRHIAEHYHLTGNGAATFVREKDRARHRYVKLNFHAAIDDPLQYHITINTTGRMSFEDAAHLIAGLVPVTS
ncbi:MAG: hypothetical protein QOD99_2713 [Chthoniobacter sp.]|nr:hypothetical protein [Chthoniobacter sp.]